ncbi:MAG TPA: dihydroorotate dehydrogenase electron transfer subunit, partial [Steroidobacteraceae bacterium]|nr:dihydroorotate dehydrogenase electron transfer subunit [Steroidobacteraceae bacterium]
MSVVPAPPAALAGRSAGQHPAHRGSIFLEEGRVLEQSAWPGEQFVLRIEAPQCAARAEPGSFVHLTCDPAVPMRRPLSIQRVDAAAGWIEILYKIVGPGLRALAQRRTGDVLSVLGPIGQGFKPDPARPRALLVGGGVGIPPMIFLADWMQQHASQGWQPLVLMGSEIPFPFKARPSTILVPGIPEGVIASMPLLDGWGIPSRLASQAGFAGCHDGFVTELADLWLASLEAESLAEVAVFSCGPTPMLRAVTDVARKHDVPCQVSLEEFMACAVGGCAGCTVLVETPSGPAMKRVCVDGPVFDAFS